MKQIIRFIPLLCGFMVYGQHISEQNTKCHKRDGFKTINKSNSLSIPQISETEKYDVHFYALDISMNNLSTYISGTGEIHGIAKNTIDSVLFELFESLNITEVRLNDIPVNYSRTNSAIKVPVNLGVGGTFKISVDYNGTPPNAATNPLGGAGMTNASSPSWGNQVTWSLSEPFSAYEWWPCKQSLTDKADSVSVKITVPNNCKGGSNGKLESVVNLGNGYSRYEWMHRHPISYYLVSVAVAEYIEYNVYANPTGAAGPILIQNYIYNNPGTLPYFQNDIDETVDFIELFSELFGMYPFEGEKYGHCMAPLSGGMEHQTMTTQGWFEKGLTAHELGHQWWGDNVTCASWADIWVNEGFASYSEYIMLENLYPGQQAQDMIDRHNYIMEVPSGSVWVEDSLNEGRIFDGRFTYDKGAAIIHTFRFMADNDDAFFQSLKNIQTIYGDSTAIGLDIRDQLQMATGVDYTNAFNEWYFGEGFPTYSARWNNIGNDILLEISHTTSSTTPTFTNPLEVKFTRLGAADTVIRVPISSNQNQFLIQGIGTVISLSKIDPNNWIINKTGTITKDANFLTSINENTKTTVLEVFPNPSKGIFSIKINDSKVQNLVIYDTRARKILQTEFIDAYTLDLTNFKSGYYLLHSTDEQGIKRIETLIKD